MLYLIDSCLVFSDSQHGPRTEALLLEYCLTQRKLQDKHILSFILKYDIVWILEGKKYFHLNVPGFDIYKNVSRVGQYRGGVVMLVKSSLVHDIKQVDTGAEGQIWVELSKWPNLKLGGIYIPPDNSPHYHPAQYGTLAIL